LSRFKTLIFSRIFRDVVSRLPAASAHGRRPTLTQPVDRRRIGNIRKPR
jgi:hypothetical protein